jgi:hypothetical protein
MSDHDDETLNVLRTVRAVTEALGGTNATAARLGIVPSAVANWLAKDCIPPTWFFRINAELKSLGHEADSSLFRQHSRKGEENAA